MRVIFLMMIGLSLLYAVITRDVATGIVSDSTTGLQWQDNEVGTATTWEDAIDRCENLTLGTHSDWRLPNVNELKSIVDRSRIYPAIKEGLVNTVASPNDYWSSTTYERDKNRAWCTDFASGTVHRKIIADDNSSKSSNNYVRCVRGGD